MTGWQYNRKQTIDRMVYLKKHLSAIILNIFQFDDTHSMWHSCSFHFAQVFPLSWRWWPFQDIFERLVNPLIFVATTSYTQYCYYYSFILFKYLPATINLLSSVEALIAYLCEGKGLLKTHAEAPLVNISVVSVKGFWSLGLFRAVILPPVTK